MAITRAGSTDVASISDMEGPVRHAQRSGRLLLLVKISDGTSNISRFVTVPMNNGQRR